MMNQFEEYTCKNCTGLNHYHIHYNIGHKSNFQGPRDFLCITATVLKRLYNHNIYTLYFYHLSYLKNLNYESYSEYNIFNPFSESSQKINLFKSSQVLKCNKNPSL